MRSRVRPTWETFLIPRRRAHYNPMRSRVARNRLGHAAMRWLVVRHGGAGVGGGWRRTVRGGVPKVTKSCKKTQTHLAPKKVTKSDTHNWNQNSYPRPLLFENKLCARRVPKHDPKMGIIFGTQNRKQNSYPRPLLFENKVCARRVPKHVPKMGIIFGTQNRNSLQPNAQPSAAKTGTIFGTQKKNSLQPHAQPSATQTAQTHVPNIVIFFEPKPEFVANQCAVELPRAGRKRRQNKFPTWWPLCVQTLGTHYNTMRS